jgi:hypothetical protein
MTDTDTVQRYLLTLAGSLMEDASAAAILSSGEPLVSRHIDALEHAARDVAAIARVLRLTGEQARHVDA